MANFMNIIFMDIYHYYIVLYSWSHDISHAVVCCIMWLARRCPRALAWKIIRRICWMKLDWELSDSFGESHKIIIFIGTTHYKWYKWQFSIAMLNYRGYYVDLLSRLLIPSPLECTFHIPLDGVSRGRLLEVFVQSWEKRHVLVAQLTRLYS